MYKRNIIMVIKCFKIQFISEMQYHQCYVKQRLGDCTGDGGGGSGEKYVEERELGDGGQDDSGSIRTSL